MGYYKKQIRSSKLVAQTSTNNIKYKVTKHKTQNH